jgi:hypothetical protein
MDVYDTYEHAGVFISIVQDDDCEGPQGFENAGTLYSWSRDFDGDERIAEPELETTCDYCEGDGCPKCNGDGVVPCTLAEYLTEHYSAALTIPVRYSSQGGQAAIWTDASDPNGALVFTTAELGDWDGNVEQATAYAIARIGELDQWLQGNCWGIIVRETEETEEQLDSCWGFIGEPLGDWIRQEANAMAEGAAERLAAEAAEVIYWANRGVETI